ncbi:branched-chain amino acid ABC transporter permease [Chloroflexota bacterium]
MIPKTRTLIISIPILIFLVIVPLYIPGYYTSLLINIFMFAILAVSWIILSGYVGYISLATAAFFGIGGYVTILLWTVFPLPLPILIIVSGLVSAIFAFVIGFPFLRIRGPYFIILTLGLSELIKNIVTIYEVRVIGAVGAVLVGTPSMETFYYSLLVVGIITIVTAQVIKNSKFGLGLFSIKGDEEAAEAMGVNTTLYKLAAFAISSLFMGCVGSIMVLRWTYVEPHIVFNPVITFQVAIMAILGGMSDFRGPILGAVVLTLISEAFGIQYPYHYMILLGITLILMVKFLPMGLLGSIERIRLKKKRV